MQTSLTSGASIAPAVRRGFARGSSTLLGALLPGALFAALLLAAHAFDARFAWVRDPTTAPWPVWIIAIAGILGLIGTTSDFLYHRRHPVVGVPEHDSHRLALLTGGVPLFVIMAAATLLARPGILLAPSVGCAFYVVMWVAYDELVFHRRRRCTKTETTFHLLATLGNGVAYLAWLHWVFAMGVSHGS